ncbi:MAG: hypothetical protein ACTSYI_02575 [Promethearchaeota archaeon]
MAFTYYLEIAAFVVGIISALAILKKDSQRLANRFLATGVFLIGFYTLCIFIYDIIGTLLAINVFLRIGMISLLFGDLFLFYTMLIMMKSTETFKRMIIPYLNLAIVVGISIFFIVTDFVHQTESTIGNVNIQIDMIPLALIILILFYLTISCVIITFRFGLNKMDKNSHGYSKLVSFAVGLFVFLLALVINIVSQITSNDVIGAIFDALTFATLLIGLVFLTFSVLDLKRKPISIPEPKSTSEIEEK